MGLSPPEYQLPALMIASMLYALNTITFCSSLRQLLRGRDCRKRGRDINFPMAVVVVLLFMSATASLALQLVHVMRDYTFLMEYRPEDFRMDRNRIDVAKMALVTLATIIADCVLLFRCWIIWNRMFVFILLPLVTWLGCLGSSIYAVQCLYFRIALEPEPIVLARNSHPGLATFWVCTIIGNLYCTGMIVGKIYSVQQGWRPPTICSLRDIPQRMRFRLASRIIMESAMMYTAASVSTFVTHICQSVAVEITCLAVIQIIGISFNWILIRPACLNQEHEHESELSAMEYRSPETSRVTVSVGVGTVNTCIEVP